MTNRVYDVRPSEPSNAMATLPLPVLGLSPTSRPANQTLGRAVGYAVSSMIHVGN